MICKNWPVTIGFWTAFALLIFLQLGFDTPFLLFNIVSTLVCVGVFILAGYLLGSVMLPYFMERKMMGFFFVTGSIVVVLLAALYVQLDTLVLRWVPHDVRLDQLVNGRSFTDRLNDVVLVMIMTTGTLCCFRFYWEHIQREKAHAQLRADRMEAELKLLREQINPHFTFNVLNSIEVLIRKDQEKASSVLLGFSQMLRYQLYDTGKETTELTQEIEYLRHYIGIESIRRGKGLQIDCRWPETATGWQLAPFLLIPLVENAFKHVSHAAHSKNYVEIRIDLEQDKLRFGIENSCQLQAPKGRGGIGLANVQKRLALLYPGRHELEIDQTGTRFSVNLVLQGPPVSIAPHSIAQ